jgi:hemerythrin-like domain-containing protein
MELASTRPAAMPKVLDIIRDEHRSIRTVLDALRYLARYNLTSTATVDPKVFRAMLHYLETYAERLHHPKEDQYLFAAMRQFGPQAEAVIAGLEREHAGGERALRDLDHCLARCEAAGEKRFASFAHAVEDYARNYFQHMKKEEEEVFPLALKLLTPGDWMVIDSAYGDDHDPFIAAQEKKDLKEVLDSIIRLAPPEASRKAEVEKRK